MVISYIVFPELGRFRRQMDDNARSTMILYQFWHFWLAIYMKLTYIKEYLGSLSRWMVTERLYRSFYLHYFHDNLLTPFTSFHGLLSEIIPNLCELSDKTMTVMIWLHQVGVCSTRSHTSCLGWGIAHVVTACMPNTLQFTPPQA